MPSDEPLLRPLDGDALLDAVTDAIVALHLIYTDVEKTMIELERSGDVHATRKEFQVAIRHKFVGVIERLSGRSVLAHISNYHVGPDLAVELFTLGTEGIPAAESGTA